MKEPAASQGEDASALISKRIADLGDWRGKTLGRMRKLIQAADPDVVEESGSGPRSPIPERRCGRTTASSARANPTRAS